MVDSQDFSLFLPRYLSPETEEKLLGDLRDFPENIDQRMYGFSGKLNDLIYQGDGLMEMSFVSFPDTKIQKVPCIVLSNTCDIEQSNQRKFNSNIVYAPIVDLAKYRALLLRQKVFSSESIDAHIGSIRRQEITQVFYLPASPTGPGESIVFLDRICSCDSAAIERESVSRKRLFSLSQYGFYLFLYKISIHFTRFYEKVDRKY